jgi:UDP-N-acetylmuramyl pentapeptide synthase
VRRYRPRIVMVTGSVGKTSTKDAVAAVLGERFFVRKSEKSFNSELGVPFTILGVGNPWHNPLAWFAIVRRAVSLIVLPNHYPNLLVLEVGADQPGDLARILRMVTPGAVVVTRLPEVPVHVEAYTSPGAVREEEFSPAYALLPAAPLIVAADDAYARAAAARVPARLLTYGTAADAAVRVKGIGFLSEDGRVTGMRAELVTGEGEHELLVRGAAGATQLRPAAAAVAVGLAFGLPVAEALAALAAYEPPAGRMRLLAGKGGSVLIDDTYNASPAAVEEALATLKAFPHAKRRVAILGDMLELGRYSVAEHERIGALARESADLVATVGIRARAMLPPDEAEPLAFDASTEAAPALAALVGAGDVVLVKGSQSMRMERVVEALLADPADAVRLVRQEPRWKARA